MTTLTEEQIRAEKKAKWFWVSFVVFLLGSQLAIGGVAIHLATGDPSVAVIPDYYNEGLNWDNAQRQREALRQLGWKLRLDASEIVDGNGLRAIELLILDQTGKSVDRLDIVGRSYHRARASENIELSFRSVGEGRYVCLCPMEKPGLWQVDLQWKFEGQVLRYAGVLDTEQAAEGSVSG